MITRTIIRLGLVALFVGVLAIGALSVDGGASVAQHCGTPRAEPTCPTTTTAPPTTTTTVPVTTTTTTPPPVVIPPPPTPIPVPPRTAG